MRFPGDRALTRRLRGFTLLELAVSLLVLGVVIGSAGSLLARTYPTAGGLAGIGTPEAERIEHALLGFLHLRHRLPCPDADGDEIEDCDAASGRPIATGYLPAATLELSLPAPGPGRDAVAYGVHRGAGGDDDLALARPERYTRVPVADPPACQPGSETLPCSVDPLEPYRAPAQLEVVDTRTLNVLDTCVALSPAASAPVGSSRAAEDASRVAWYVTLPTGRGERTVARTFAEVAAALGCAERLADAELTRLAAATLAAHEQVNRFRLAHLDVLRAATAVTAHAGERTPAGAGADPLALLAAPSGYPQTDRAQAVVEAAPGDDAAASVRERLRLAGARLVEARAVAEAVQRRGGL